MSMMGIEVTAHNIAVANSDGVTIYYNWINKDYSHPQYNASLEKKQNICVRNRVNILPKCGFLNYFLYLCTRKRAKLFTLGN